MLHHINVAFSRNCTRAVCSSLARWSLALCMPPAVCMLRALEMVRETERKIIVRNKREFAGSEYVCALYLGTL